MSETPLLEVEGLTVGYGGAPIVRGIDLGPATGRMNCIVGPNGAGKSTALKAIAGVLMPMAGKVTFEGSDVTKLSTDARVARGLGYVPQVANVFATLTVMENLQVGSHTRRKTMKERLDTVFELFPPLKDATARPAGTLSGGQRSMLALSRALMGAPRLLLLDEPTAGLAPKLIDDVWDHIITIQQHGIGVLIVEQNTRRALTHSDWGYVMVDGQVAADGAASDMLTRPDLVEMYLGGG
jgi:branched-chain amino acid transport system ATP-binding protein